MEGTLRVLPACWTNRQRLPLTLSSCESESDGGEVLGVLGTTNSSEGGIPDSAGIVGEDTEWVKYPRM